MSNDDRIAALEAEIRHRTEMAVNMMVGLCFVIAHTPDGLREMATRFAPAAEDPDPAIAQLATGLQKALHEAAEKLERHPGSG